MSFTAIILLIIAAFAHATWNFIGKSRNPTAAFFLVANTAGIFILLPAVFYRPDATASMSAEVWLMVVATGLCQAVYFTALAGAYRNGHMSIAYPLARSSPVIVVMIVSILLGRGSEVSWLCTIGIVMVVGGCFLLPMKFFRDFRVSNYLNATCLFALIAALGTAGYSLIDDQALRTLRAMQVNVGSNINTTMTYAFWEGCSQVIWLALFVLFSGERKSVKIVIAKHRKPALLAGVAMYFTYTLVLISMAFVKNISYVVGFRQLSVPLGALMGIMLLKEPRPLPKLIGVAIIFAGLVLIGFG